MSAEIVERGLELSKADAAVVIASASSTVNLRWANNTLTTNGSTVHTSVVVVSIVGRSFGVRSATVADVAQLETIVRGAEADARGANEAEDFDTLIDGGQSANFTDAPDRTSTAVFETFAKELGEAFRSARSDGRRLFGFAEHDMTTVWLGTSSGTRLRHSQPTGSVEWTAKDSSARGSVWHGEATVDFSDISPASTDALLRKRLGWCANSVDLPAGRYETLLPPAALADLMITTYWGAAGREAAEGRTAFSKPNGGTRVGDAIANPGITMFSDPNDGQLATTPFVTAGTSSATSSVFDNGVPLSRSTWIDEGKLTSLVETRTSARNRSVPFTPASGNLVIESPGTDSLEQMISRTERGLLLTSLWYIREVDPQRMLLTGLTRDGVYLVEGGEIVGAVNNFRFNESPIELLGRITDIGASVRTLPREWSDYFKLTRMPPVRVPDFNMSTVSPAS